MSLIPLWAKALIVAALLAACAWAIHRLDVSRQEIGYQRAIHKKTQKFALFSGICYQHTEDYLGAQGNSQKPGVWLLNEVKDGNADLLQVSLNYLRRLYG